MAASEAPNAINPDSDFYRPNEKGIGVFCLNLLVLEYESGTGFFPGANLPRLKGRLKENRPIIAKVPAGISNPRMLVDRRVKVNVGFPWEFSTGGSLKSDPVSGALKVDFSLLQA